jgi:hypothetical protein
MTVPPDFRDLLGDDLPAEERARLERVHDLLVEAGPPPELPPSLAETPDRGVEEVPTWLPRRRAGAALSLAAAIALVAFLGGYVFGFSHNDFTSTREESMQGTANAPGARGLIKLGEQDEAGNWEMVVTVKGLRPLPGRGYYELFLVHGGKPPLKCGIFNVKAGTTSMKFTVPYTFEPDDAWIVTQWRRGERDPGPALLTTT